MWASVVRSPVQKRACSGLDLTVENAQMRDQVTALRASLRTVSTQLLGAEEAERRHITRTLHDEPGDVLCPSLLTATRCTYTSVTYASAQAYPAPR